MAKILLLGVNQPLADQLRQVLGQQHHQVCSEPLPAEANTRELLDRVDADVLFSGADNPRYRQLLAASRRHKPHVPFIVVTRLPEISEWLNALEAGATDYCSAPFEPRQVRWVLEAALPRAAAALA